MSFRCESCGVAEPDYSRPTMRVIETRPREYYYRGDDDPRGQDGHGTEIVREIRLCEACAL